MKASYFSILSLLAMIFFLIDVGRAQDVEHLICEEYWSKVPLSEFCELTLTDFKLNDIPNDICNADQGSTYRFSDQVSIRVFNHFTSEFAKQEYDTEEEDAQTLKGYASIDDLGDHAFVLLTAETDKLGFAIVQVLKGNYTIYLEVNGNSARNSNNCFDAKTVIDFARALAKPL